MEAGRDLRDLHRRDRLSTRRTSCSGSSSPACRRGRRPPASKTVGGVAGSGWPRWSERPLQGYRSRQHQRQRRQMILPITRSSACWWTTALWDSASTRHFGSCCCPPCSRCPKAEKIFWLVVFASFAPSFLSGSAEHDKVLWFLAPWCLRRRRRCGAGPRHRRRGRLRCKHFARRVKRPLFLKPRLHPMSNANKLDAACRLGEIPRGRSRRVALGATRTNYRRGDALPRAGPFLRRLVAAGRARPAPWPTPRRPTGCWPSTRSPACCGARPACRCWRLNRLLLRRGWFVPVSPGTQFVTLGGMVASDVHGKNHHVDGCFGQHVRSLKLRVADGRVLECSDEHEARTLPRDHRRHGIDRPHPGSRVPHAPHPLALDLGREPADRRFGRHGGRAERGRQDLAHDRGLGRLPGPRRRPGTRHPHDSGRWAEAHEAPPRPPRGQTPLPHPLPVSPLGAGPLEHEGLQPGLLLETLPAARTAASFIPTPSSTRWTRWTIGT